MNRNLIAPLAMTLVIPSTLVAAALLLEVPLGAAALPLAWATGALGAVLRLGSRASRPVRTPAERDEFQAAA